MKSDTDGWVSENIVGFLALINGTSQSDLRKATDIVV